MKKRLRFGSFVLTSALALSLGSVSAFAEEVSLPAFVVTVNGEVAPIHTEMINGKPYFSLRDYWVNIADRKAANIKWYGEASTVSDGSLFLRLNDQTYDVPTTKEHGSLTDPAILKDGRVLVAASYFQDVQKAGRENWLLSEQEENSLHFRKTIWEQWDAPEAKDEIRFAPIPVEEKRGLPNFSHLSPFTEYDFNDADYNITKTDSQDGKTTVTYVSKKDPSATLLVTIVDGYVTHVLDTKAINLYRPRG